MFSRRLPPLPWLLDGVYVSLISQAAHVPAAYYRKQRNLRSTRSLAHPRYEENVRVIHLACILSFARAQAVPAPRSARVNTGSDASLPSPFPRNNCEIVSDTLGTHGGVSCFVYRVETMLLCAITRLSLSIQRRVGSVVTL